MFYTYFLLPLLSSRFHGDNEEISIFHYFIDSRCLLINGWDHCQRRGKVLVKYNTGLPRTQQLELCFFLICSSKHEDARSIIQLPVFSPYRSGVDTNFEKLETVGLPTHNSQEPQVKFRSPNLFFTIRPAPPGKSSWRAIGVSGHNIANVEVDFYMLHSVIYF